MTPTRRSCAAALSAIALVTTSLVAATAPAGATAAATQAAPVRLDANLRPSGDANGRGHAKVRLNRAANRVCATITWSRIGSPNAAHIHRKSDGGVVVDLTGSVTGGAKCANGVGKRLIGKILDRPGRYYVNVHNAPYPAGAIQGNLHR